MDEIFWVGFYLIHIFLIVSTGDNALRGKLHQLGSPNLKDIFIGR